MLRSFERREGENPLSILLYSGRLSLHAGTTPHYPFNGVAKIAISAEIGKSSARYLLFTPLDYVV